MKKKLTTKDKIKLLASPPLAVASIGAEPPSVVVVTPQDDSTTKTLILVGEALSLAGAASGAYHGYKRNKGSVGWAIGWGVLGALFPVITIPVSLAQGFGKRK